jgi:hypothetical protein
MQLLGVFVGKIVRHTLGEFSGSVHSFSVAAFAAPATLPEKENCCMKDDKNLRFCIDELQSMQNRDGLEPEQRSALENAKSKLKCLRRKPHPSRKEVFEVVREVAEAIIKVFVS